MRQPPGEVLEAPQVDGGNWLEFCCAPCRSSLGGVATVVIFTALFWNEFLMPLFLTSRDAGTFTVVPTTFWGQTDTVREQIAAGATSQILPVAILAFLIQRHIVAGSTMGAVKYGEDNVTSAYTNRETHTTLRS